MINKATKQRITILTYCIIALSITAPYTQAKNSKYRLSWRADPSTTMVVGWDQTSGSNPVVQYSTGKLEGKSIKSHKPDRTEIYMGMTNTFARLANLKPDTLYNFRIKDSEGLSQAMSFRTAPAKPQEFAFITGGDSRGNRKVRTAGNVVVSKLRPLFVLFGGDYVGSVQPKLCQKWLDDWQSTRSEDGRMYPLIPTHGNHENNDFFAVSKLFDVVNPSTYYSLNIGGDFMRIYALNSELQFKSKLKWKQQATWLRKDLKNSEDINWKVIAYHRPFRPHTSNKSEMLGSIKAWAHLFYEYGVNLAVESDSHTVKRTYPLKPDEGPDSFESFIRDDKRGTTFIGEGTWGAPLRPANDDKPWTMASGSFYQFKLIHVFKDHMDIRSIKFDNAAELTANTEGNNMGLPKNLDIWTPESGAVLRVNQHEK